jgi:hypothetical protein
MRKRPQHFRHDDIPLGISAYKYFLTLNPELCHSAHACVSAKGRQVQMHSTQKSKSDMRPHCPNQRPGYPCLSGHLSLLFWLGTWQELASERTVPTDLHASRVATRGGGAIRPLALYIPAPYDTLPKAAHRDSNEGEAKMIGEGS